MQALTVVLVLIFLEACASSLTSTHVPSLSATPLLVNRHLVLSCLPGLRLRGGTSTGDAQGGIEAMQDDGSSAQGGKDPRDWAEADVLAFVESLRQKFGSKTDTYLECFK